MTAPGTMTRPIVTAPASVLRASARHVRVPDRAIDRLVTELFATMRAARGVGLAAPQIGESVAVAVVEAEGRRLVLINPKVARAAGSQDGWEGCLSIPDRVAWLSRAADVSVASLDLSGRSVRYRASGLVARAVLHEVDHLAGRLYSDLVGPDELIDTTLHPTPPQPGERGAAP